MSEFIGSRISLISKSDIRYVGTLHEINSENSTVALEQVKSFGTEGRRGNPSEELAGSDSIYEYIVFRGSDVKDLRIEETPKETQPASRVPDDPAILGGGQRPESASTVTSAHPQQYQHQQPYGYPPFNGGYPAPRFAGQHGQQSGPSGPPPNGFPSYPPMPYAGPPPGYYGSPGHHMPPPGPFPHPHSGPFGAPAVPPQPVLGQNQGSSEVTKPGPVSSEPNSSGGIQEKETPAPAAKQPKAQKHAAAASTAAGNSTVAPRPPIESKPPVAAAKAAPANTANGSSGKKGKIIPAMPLPMAATEKDISGPEISRSSQATANAALQYQNATQAATAAVAAAMAKLPPMGTHTDSKQPAEIDGTLAKAVNNMRLDNRARNGSQSERGQRGGRGGRRGGREPAKPVEVPTTDFDFESANAKFNKQDLVKEAIATGSPSGNAGHGDGTADSAPEVSKDVTIPAAVPLYDKSSFFDNISSEARDREEAADGNRRPNGNEFRSEERKRNIETFGMGSVDNRFSGHRGRGRGRRGGYRGRGGFRGGRGALNVVQ